MKISVTFDPTLSKDRKQTYKIKLFQIIQDLKATQTCVTLTNCSKTDTSPTKDISYEPISPMQSAFVKNNSFQSARGVHENFLLAMDNNYSTVTICSKCKVLQKEVSQLKIAVQCKIDQLQRLIGIQTSAYKQESKNYQHKKRRTQNIVDSHLNQQLGDLLLSADSCYDDYFRHSQQVHYSNDASQQTPVRQKTIDTNPRSSHHKEIQMSKSSINKMSDININRGPHSSKGILFPPTPTSIAQRVRRQSMENNFCLLDPQLSTNLFSDGQLTQICDIMRPQGLLSPKCTKYSSGKEVTRSRASENYFREGPQQAVSELNRTEGFFTQKKTMEQFESKFRRLEQRYERVKVNSIKKDSVK